MNRYGPALLVISAIIIIILAFTAITINISKENEKDKKISLQKQIDEFIIKEQNFEVKIKDADIANAQMASSIKFQEEKISALSKDLEDEKSTHGKDLARLHGKENEIQNLKARIEEIKAEKEDVVKSLEKLNEDFLNMKFYMESLVKTKEELEKRAKELSEKEGVSLGTVVIKQSRN